MLWTNDEIPENRAHFNQRVPTTKDTEEKEKGMFISVVRNGNGDDNLCAAIVGENREVYEQEVSDGGSDEAIIIHEPMFDKPESEYDTGEGVISAIARTAGNDDEAPGSALERLVKQVFLLGMAHGVNTERARVIARLTGD